MHVTNIELEDITLLDLLTVDTQGERINIYDRSAGKAYELIPNRQTFFHPNGLFAEVEENSLLEIQADCKVPIDLGNLLNNINSSRESCIVLIEGFAGCGKSTLVQYILANQLNTYNYDYNLYNYDLEAQNDIIIHDEFGNIIQKSSIYEAIKKSFYEQFVRAMESNSSVIDELIALLKHCRFFQPFDDLYHNFYNTDTFSEMLSYIKAGVVENEDIIMRVLKRQVNQISSTTCLLALDYLLRLSMYKNRMIKKLYICYDNLDAIEDATDLSCFDEVLASFRAFIDSYIFLLQKNGFFNDLPTPHFVVLATYRKITAVVANIAKTAYKEVKKDNGAGFNHNKTIYYIDATSTFSYSKIVAKRHAFFKEYFKNIPEICISREKKEVILNNFFSWSTLNKKLEIMNDRYACLWNKNYRTCSLIANKLYAESEFKFSNSVEFINSSPINDGYDISNDDEGSNILCTYYGSSAILLSNVCKVLNYYHIWDNLLNLTSLNSGNVSPKNVSFSRLILTYMYNVDRPVSLSELFSFFCENKLFSYKKLCHVLSKMLARNLDGVWRRPIYYSHDCILSEDAEDIEDALSDECNKLIAKESPSHNYQFILCESGKTYVERLMQEYEFFSNRLSNSNKSLYFCQETDDLENSINNVFNAVSLCCQNMNLFRKRYIALTGISAEKYLSLPIHPTTNIRHSPQLHTERIIFSHIAYLNNVRRYFLNKKVTPTLERRKAYNLVFVNAIGKYLDLYATYILPLCQKRSSVYKKLKRIVDNIKTESQHGNNPLILFQPVSIKKDEGYVDI